VTRSAERDQLLDGVRITAENKGMDVMCFEPVTRAAQPAPPAVATLRPRWLPADQERWRAHLTDDEPPEVAFYCPECGEREFGRD
jgi:hypothetical protein